MSFVHSHSGGLYLDVYLLDTGINHSGKCVAVSHDFSLHGIWNEAGQRLIEFCQENALIIANTLFQQHKRRFYTWTSPNGQYQNHIDYIFAAEDGKALYSQQKQDQELTVAQIINSLLQNSDLE